MKKIVAIFGILALAACSSGGSDGSDSGVDLTPDIPSTSLNTEFGTALNDLRAGNSQTALTYDSTVGEAAQIHANDMYENDYLSIFLEETSEDMGDTLNNLGLSWDEIAQFIAQGEYEVDTLLTEWDENGSQGDGSIAVLDDLNFPDYELFGLAKAGDGDDSRWVLLLVNPT